MSSLREDAPLPRWPEFSALLLRVYQEQREAFRLRPELLRATFQPHFRRPVYGVAADHGNAITRLRKTPRTAPEQQRDYVPTWAQPLE